MYGSVATELAIPSSDLDLMVEINYGKEDNEGKRQQGNEKENEKEGREIR